MYNQGLGKYNVTQQELNDMGYALKGGKFKNRLGQQVDPYDIPLPMRAQVPAFMDKASGYASNLYDSASNVAGQIKGGLEDWANRNPNWKSDAYAFTKGIVDAQNRGEDGLLAGIDAAVQAKQGRIDKEKEYQAGAMDRQLKRMEYEQKLKEYVESKKSPEEKARDKYELTITKFMLDRNITDRAEAKKQYAEMSARDKQLEQDKVQAEIDNYNSLIGRREALNVNTLANAALNYARAETEKFTQAYKSAETDAKRQEIINSAIEAEKLRQQLQQAKEDAKSDAAKAMQGFVDAVKLDKSIPDDQKEAEITRRFAQWAKQQEILDKTAVDQAVANLKSTQQENAGFGKSDIYLEWENAIKDGSIPKDTTYLQYRQQITNADQAIKLSEGVSDFLYLKQQGLLPEGGETLPAYMKLVNSKNDATQRKITNFANSFYNSINDKTKITLEQADDYATMFATDPKGKAVLRKVASKLNKEGNTLTLEEAVDEAIKESEYTQAMKNAVSAEVKAMKDEDAKRKKGTQVGITGGKNKSDLWKDEVKEFKAGKAVLEKAITNYNAVLVVLKKLPDNTFTLQMPIKQAMAGIQGLVTGEPPAWVGVVDNLQKLTTEMTFAYIAQTKGAITEREMDLFKRAVVSLDGTKQSNIQYVEYKREKAQQKINLFNSILNKLQNMPDDEQRPITEAEIKQMKEQAKAVNPNYTDDVEQKWLDYALPQADTTPPSNVVVIDPKFIEILNTNKDDPEYLKYFKETFGVNPEDYIE